MTLRAVEPIDPHAIIETCPRCSRQRVIGYISPQFMEAVGLCDVCRRDARILAFYRRMWKTARTFAGLRPFAGYVEWVLSKNDRFIAPLADNHGDGA